jgi:hypothetical protein
MQAENRTLVLTRRIAHFETNVCAPLEGHMRTLLAALKYRGKLEVEFPVLRREVVVRREPGNWVLGLLRVYPEKRVGVGEGVWDVGAGVGGEGEGEGRGGARRAVEGWWREWEGVVRNAVLGKVRGKVGVEDWIGWRSGLREGERRGEWGLDGMSEWLQ